MANETPVIDVPQPEAKAVPAPEKVSPAKDLRDIQSLLVMGIFPGQMAPAVVKAYQLLEQMAVQVEADANAQAK